MDPSCWGGGILLLGAAMAEVLAPNATSNIPGVIFGGLCPAGVAQAFTVAPLQCTVGNALGLGAVVLVVCYWVRCRSRT